MLPGEQAADDLDRLEAVLFGVAGRDVGEQAVEDFQRRGGRWGVIKSGAEGEG